MYVSFLYHHDRQSYTKLSFEHITSATCSLNILFILVSIISSSSIHFFISAHKIHHSIDLLFSLGKRYLSKLKSLSITAVKCMHQCRRVSFINTQPVKQTMNWCYIMLYLYGYFTEAVVSNKCIYIIATHLYQKQP